MLNFQRCFAVDVEFQEIFLQRILKFNRCLAGDVKIHEVSCRGCRGPIDVLQGMLKFTKCLEGDAEFQKLSCGGCRSSRDILQGMMKFSQQQVRTVICSEMFFRVALQKCSNVSKENPPSIFSASIPIVSHVQPPLGLKPLWGRFPMKVATRLHLFAMLGTCGRKCVTVQAFGNDSNQSEFDSGGRLRSDKILVMHATIRSRTFCLLVCFQRT
jgi:hypothetical protein